MSAAAILWTLSITLLFSVLPATAQHFELIWADEFDGTEVDQTKWEFQIGDGCDMDLCGWGNNEKQWYQAANATVEDGFLTITAKKEEVNGYPYTSARLRTKGMGDWTFGRFEARAKMPVGQGLWSAFWMLPSDEIYGGWAASGEIDVMEYLGHEPYKVFGTIHYGGPSPANVFSSEDYLLETGTFADDFHVFAIEWEINEIRWYVDDLHYATQTSDTWYSTGGPSSAPFDRSFYALLNIAVGGNLPGDPDESTVFPQEMIVDYFRVYQLSEEVGTEMRGMEANVAFGAPFPNPFTRWTQFELSVTQSQEITVELFDALGRPVASVFHGVVPGNTTQVIPINGQGLPSGIYLCRIVGEHLVESRKLVVVRE